MTIVPKKKSDSRSTNKPNVVVPKNKQQDQDSQHQEHREHLLEHHEDHHRRSPNECSSSHVGPAGEDGDYSGYNSGDEHTHDRQPSYMQWTEQEFEERELQFEQSINKKGWVIKKMAEDGACLFRAVADQIYGDQEMHSVLRKLCIDYIAKNSDYFSQYVTEDFGEYLKRKSLDHSHGNHIEIQAMSEMFNRPIEVYHYSSEPINIFQGSSNENEPIRLSYHRSVHYNSIVDPFKATVGVGLGLPAYDPGIADRSLLEDAIRLSDEDAIEKAMLEDKLLATDWEATNEAIEEQVARESYLEWLRENENRFHKKFKKSSSPQPTTAAASAACSKQSSSTSSSPSSSSYHNHQSHHHNNNQSNLLHSQLNLSSTSSTSKTLAPEQIAGCSTSSVSASMVPSPPPSSSSLPSSSTSKSPTSKASPNSRSSPYGTRQSPDIYSNSGVLSELYGGASTSSATAVHLPAGPSASHKFDYGPCCSSPNSLDRRSPRASSSRDIS